MGNKTPKRLAIIITILILFSAAAYAQDEDREAFDDNPTSENFNKISSPTAADLSKVSSPTTDNFNRLNNAEKDRYLNTADFSNPSNRNIAYEHFTDPSQSGDRINQNKDTFGKYLDAEGIDVRGIDGDVTEFKKDGTLIGADDRDSINVNDFKEGEPRSDYAINIDNEGNIHLIQKESGNDIAISGNLQIDDTGNFKINGPGSFTIDGQVTEFRDGDNIEIDNEGNIRGRFSYFKGIAFRESTPLTYDSDTLSVSLRDTEITGISDDTTISIIGKNVALPYTANDIRITINDGTMKFDNGMISIPSQTTTVLGNFERNSAPMLTITAEDETFIGIGSSFPIRDNVIQLGNQFQAKGDGYRIRINPSNSYIQAVYRPDQYLSLDMNGGAVSYDKNTNTLEIISVDQDGSVDIVNGRQSIHYSMTDGKMEYDNMLYSADSEVNMLEANINIASGDLIAFEEREMYKDPVIKAFQQGLHDAVHIVTHLDNLITLDPSITGGTIADYSMEKASDIYEFHDYNLNEVYPDGLGQHKATAIPVDDFTARMADTDTQSESLTGAWSQYDTAVAGTDEEMIRYVRDPVNPDYVIDMKHFMKAGSVSIVSDTVGDAVELGQFWTAMADGGEIISGGNPQDYYSNRLGSEFFRYHYDSSSDKPMSQQINEFLKDHPQ